MVKETKTPSPTKQNSKRIVLGVALAVLLLIGAGWGLFLKGKVGQVPPKERLIASPSPSLRLSPSPFRAGPQDEVSQTEQELSQLERELSELDTIESELNVPEVDFELGF